MYSLFDLFLCIFWNGVYMHVGVVKITIMRDQCHSNNENIE
jgi:hypothetical protein